MDLNEVAKLASIAAGVLGTVYWAWVLPERKRRDDVQNRLIELEKWQAVAKRDLAAGDKKFDEMAADIKDIKATIHRLEKVLAGVAPALTREVGE